MSIFSIRTMISSAILIAIGAGVFYSLEHQKQAHNIEIVKSSFDVFNKTDIESAVDEFHSKDYIQYSDGKVLSRDDFVKHVEYVKSILASPVTITFDVITASGDYVTTVHRASAVKKNNEKVEIKVIAIFKIKNNKIVSTDELSRVMVGAAEDAEMGSKHE